MAVLGFSLQQLAAVFCSENKKEFRSQRTIDPKFCDVTDECHFGQGNFLHLWSFLKKLFEFKMTLRRVLDMRNLIKLLAQKGAYYCQLKEGVSRTCIH